MSEATSIDELLMAEMARVKHSAPDPIMEEIKESQSVSESTSPIPEVTSPTPHPEPEKVPHETNEGSQSDVSDNTDEYGNEVKTTEERLYTKRERDEFANELVRERLARERMARERAQQSQPQSSHTDADDGDWNAQLETFVENTFSKIQQKQATEYYMQQEQLRAQEFQDRFTRGMENFHDFNRVVDPTDFSDSMTRATHAMKDPAAFVYAASKKAKDELRRISQIMDPTTQMVEMGRLEERLKKTPSITQSPKPMSKTKSDIEIPQPAKKTDPRETNIDDLIAQDTAKRLARQNSRRR